MSTEEVTYGTSGASGYTVGIGGVSGVSGYSYGISGVSGYSVGTCGVSDCTCGGIIGNPDYLTTPEEKTAYEVSLKYPIGLSDGTCGEYEWETIIVVTDSISKIIEHFDESLIENISVRGKGITLN
jgi:hypothetical protein